MVRNKSNNIDEVFMVCIGFCFVVQKEELYQKNISENDFSNSEIDGIGDDNNANN